MIKRELSLKKTAIPEGSANIIKVLTGMRRAGESALLELTKDMSVMNTQNAVDRECIPW